MTEFCGKDSVDLGSHHAAFLIGYQCRVVFEKAFSDDVGVDVFCGAFHQLRLGVDSLADDVIAFKFEFCCQVLKCFLFGVFGAQDALFFEFRVFIS